MSNSQCWYSSLNFEESYNKYLENWQTLFSKGTDYYSTRLVNDFNVTTCTHKSDICPHYFCLPKVILGGFPKAGTTTMYNLISSHPSIAEPLQKERHFWREYICDSHYNGFHNVAVLSYLFYFKKSAILMENNPGVRFTIDGSASTVFAGSNHANKSHIMDIVKNACMTPLLLYRLLPETKFIFIVRNPIDRLWSDFWYTCSKRIKFDESKRLTAAMQYMYLNASSIFHNYTISEIKKFKRCMTRHNSGLKCVMKANSEIGKLSACKAVRLGLSIYYHHLKKWYEIFPRSNILVLKFENFVHNITSTMKKIWAFLELEEMQSEKIEQLMYTVEQNSLHSWIKVNPSEKFTMFPETKALLYNFFNPYNVKLAVLLNDSNYLW